MKEKLGGMGGSHKQIINYNSKEGEEVRNIVYKKFWKREE